MQNYLNSQSKRKQRAKAHAYAMEIIANGFKTMNKDDTTASDLFIMADAQPKHMRTEPEDVKFKAYTEPKRSAACKNAR